MSKSNYLDLIKDLSIGFLEHTGLYSSVQEVTLHEELFYLVVLEILSENEIDKDPRSYNEIAINLDIGPLTIKKGHK